MRALLPSRPLVVVGDCLLDRDLVGRVDRLCPDAPVPVVDEVHTATRPGGAGLAALLAAGDGRSVVLVTALGSDAAGRELATLLADAGVQVLDLGLTGRTPEKLRVRSDGRSLLRVDRGTAAPGAVGAMTRMAYDAVAHGAGVLVSDYGRGVAATAGVGDALRALPGRTPMVWDPHPRGAVPLPGAALVTPNDREARRFATEVDGDGMAASTARARLLATRWHATAVAITLGAQGALLVSGDGPPLVVPAPTLRVADVCGAGDRFAATAAGLLADGELPSEAVTGAVEAAATFLAAGGVGGLTHGGIELMHAEQGAAQLAARVRASNGVVVATGGCFDVLHSGHVAVLQQARALGGCLVVCLNSDASVRRLKGPGRPVVPEQDRIAVLRALDCVDAVAVFDEDTPAALLDTFRPDVFAKGGDYALTDIPEARVLASWGGQAVVLPYVAGKSSTAILREAARRGR